MSLNQIKIYRPGVIQLALNLLTFVYLHTLTITAIKKFPSNGICKKFRFCKKMEQRWFLKMVIHRLGVLFENATEENAFLNGSLAIYGTRQLATHN